MKITEISKEYLEKGGLIRRKGWAENISLSFNKDTNIFDVYCNDVVTGENKFTLDDITSDDWELVGKKWQPEEGETYYLISTRGSVESTLYQSISIVDRERIRFGNCFKTREEVVKIINRIKIIKQLQELSNINFNEVLDEQKWYITYNHTASTIECDTSYHVQRTPFGIYFKNEEDCRNAIKAIGEDNLKKYYFDVED